MDKLDSTKFAVCTLAIRFTQGWIFFSAGLRRFFTNPEKLDASSVHYMAYKLNHAMPGALFGMDHVVSFVLERAALLQFAIIAFTTTEFLVGIGLILGIFTRFFALVSVGLAIFLMLIFGWLGTTCLDEWTMSSCNLAIGLVLLITGGGMLSVDNGLNRMMPSLKNAHFFQAVAGVTFSPKQSLRWGALFGFTALAFTVSFYGILFKGLIGPIKHRTPLLQHSVDVSWVGVNGDSVSFSAYVDGGPDTQGAYIIKASLVGADGEELANWNGAELAKLPADAFVNTYRFSTFKPTEYGIMGAAGAKGTITLPLDHELKNNQATKLILTNIEGVQWES